jgi:hypothetical protein
MGARRRRSNLSEYQYYEFRTVDRPLTQADRNALRQLSTRARITSTSFTKSYEWGDFKGDPTRLVEQWFDLHLYLANWGTRRLMIRVPGRFVDRQRFDVFLREIDWVEIRTAGENLVIDILQEEDGGDWDNRWYDDESESYGSGWLAAMEPLRADLLAGGFKLFYLVWLMAVEADLLEPDAAEPIPGLGPMTEALAAFADFFHLDPDLVQAAAELPADSAAEGGEFSDAMRRSIEAMSDSEKTDMLLRLVDGDPYVASELQLRVRKGLSSAAGGPAPVLRTIGELRSRAEAIRSAREQAQAEEAAAAKRKQAQLEEQERQARISALAQRGESVWKEVETEIERRNASGYDKAAGLICDLHGLAQQSGSLKDFSRRLGAIRLRHANKMRFIERLAKLA